MRKVSLAAALLCATAVAAGCGGDDGSSTSTAAAGGEDGGGTQSFTVAVVDPDLGAIALLEAIEQLKADGHDVESVEVAEPELAIEGLARGRFDFSGETTSTALAAAQQGAPVKLIGDLVANAWSVWAKDDVADCADLDGKRFGIFSQGSVATAMVKNWIAETCPGTEPEYLVLGESSTRFAALKAGEIDATTLELADAVQLEKDPGNLHQLVDFQEALADLRPSTLYANSEFVADNPEATQTFIDAVADVGAKIEGDPEYLAGLIEKHMPDFEGEALDTVARAYAERDMYDVAALTPENLQYTLDFFAKAGSIDDGLSPEDAAELSFLSSSGETR